MFPHRSAALCLRSCRFKGQDSEKWRQRPAYLRTHCSSAKYLSWPSLLNGILDVITANVSLHRFSILCYRYYHFTSSCLNDSKCKDKSRGVTTRYVQFLLAQIFILKSVTQSRSRRIITVNFLLSSLLGSYFNDSNSDSGGTILSFVYSGRQIRP